MTVQIRAAEPGEEQRLVPLYEWLFAPPGSLPPAWDERRAAVALRQAIDSHDCAVIVAEGEDGELVGICTVYLDLHSVRFGYRAWIEDLVVDPGRRSEGIGKRLLDAAKDWAREHGATHLELDSAETRSDAHRFYEREAPSWRSVSYAWEL
jgi:GNAT superfamily N-acetyltransferase